MLRGWCWTQLTERTLQEANGLVTRTGAQAARRNLEGDDQGDIEIFGTPPDGCEVRRYGCVALAAASWRSRPRRDRAGLPPDADDPASEVVVHFDALDDYVAARQAYLGAVVGRYANRIAGRRRRWTQELHADGERGDGRCMAASTVSTSA